MADPAHRIGKQNLEIAVDSEAAALALQPRLSDINRQRFLPVIERVLDELAVPGFHVKLGAVDVDLGDVVLEDLDGAVEAQLYGALREAVERALRDVRDDSDAEQAAKPETMAELETLEFFLVHGALPFGAPAA